MTDPAPETNEQVSTDPAPSFLMSIWQAIAPEWNFVLVELLKPIPFLLLGFTIVLVFAQVHIANSWGPDSGNENAGSLNALVILVISIASSVLGALMYDRWKQSQEQSLLATKGMSALRGLNLLLRATRNQKKKLEEYRDSSEQFGEMTKREYLTILQQLDESCTALEMQIVGASEEWGDILPASVSDIRSKVDMFMEIEQERTDAKNQLQLVSQQYIETQNKLGKLEAEPQINREFVKQLEDELRSQELRANELQQRLTSIADTSRRTEFYDPELFTPRQRRELAQSRDTRPGRGVDTRVRAKNIPGAGVPVPEVDPSSVPDHNSQ